MPVHQRIKIAPDALPWKFFAALALHLHNIRAVIVYTCIIPRVTISMFKIGFSQKGWTFSPRVVPDFFQARLFLFWAISDLGGFADDRNTSALTQWLRNKKSNTQKNVLIAYWRPVAMLLAVLNTSLYVPNVNDVLPCHIRNFIHHNYSMFISR